MGMSPAALKLRAVGRNERRHRRQERTDVQIRLWCDTSLVAKRCPRGTTSGGMVCASAGCANFAARPLQRAEAQVPSMTKPVMAKPSAAEADVPDEEAEGEAPKPAKPAEAEADEEPEDDEAPPKPAVTKPAAAEADDEDSEARPRSRRSRCPSARPPAGELWPP